jgi:uncharacterized protein (TIGR02466 family)
MSLHYWFPTVLYIKENVFSDAENEQIKNLFFNVIKNYEKGGKNWISDVYNTLGSYNLKNDKNFNFLIEKVNENVNLFAKELQSDYTYNCDDGWINLYNAGDYQEWHTHSNSIFSAVYFVTNPEKSGKLYFENPYEPDMLPLKNVKNYNEVNSLNCSYNFKPKTLVIFRSNVKHMVQKCNNETPRITAAFNIS